MTTHLKQTDIFNIIVSGIEIADKHFQLSSDQIQGLLKYSTDIAGMLRSSAEKESKVEAGSSVGITRWLTGDDVGESSLFLLSVLRPYLTLGPVYAEPSDTGDFGRCVKLLEADPLLRRDLGKVSSMSETWKRLVSQWDIIEESLNAENPKWRKSYSPAPNTRALIDACIESIA